MNPEKFYEEKKGDQRNRVEKLRKNDGPGEDSVRILAEKQNKFWDEIKERSEKKGIYLKKEFITQLANYFGDEILERMECEMEIQEESYTDELTQCFNRKYMEDKMSVFLETAHRYEKDVSVIMVDIDYFKKVNDEHGHPVGDKVLSKISHLLKDGLRKIDKVIRYGGEEFAIFLFGADQSDAEKVAEKIRKSIEDLVIEVQGENDSNLELKKTVSLGCMSTSDLEKWSVKDKKDKKFNNLDMNKVIEELVQKADQALYYSKNNGRNQVTSYSKELKEK